MIWMTKKKGSLKETLSFALYGDNSRLFKVKYRDKNTFKTVELDEFMNREDLKDIPITRIITISRGDEVVWRKGQKEVSLKSRAAKYENCDPIST